MLEVPLAGVGAVLRRGLWSNDYGKQRMSTRLLYHGQEYDNVATSQRSAVGRPEKRPTLENTRTLRLLASNERHSRPLSSSYV